MTLTAFEGLHTIFADMPAMCAAHRAPAVAEDDDTRAQTTVCANSRRTERLTKEERREQHQLKLVANSYRRKTAREFEDDFYRALNVA
jgi:hypothetical protein